jgi:hypothetical protein
MAKPTLKIYVYISSKKIGLGSNGKRIVAYLNTEASKLLNMTSVIFDSHNLLLKKPSEFANNAIVIRNQQFNLKFRHEELEGEYEIVECQNPETFKLEKIHENILNHI